MALGRGPGGDSVSLLGGIAALASLTVDIATTVSAIKKIKAGGNSAEVAKVVGAMERQLRQMTAKRLKQVRKKHLQKRDSSGRYT